MKHGLVIDELGTLAGFVRGAVRPFEYHMTTVLSFTEGLALLAEESFDLVILAQRERCPGSLWKVVELIKERSPNPSLLIVFAEDSDSAFQARARNSGVAVLCSPALIPATAAFEEEAALG